MLRVLLLAIACAVAGCSAESSTLRWTEEIRLPDGRVVLLNREQSFDKRDLVSSYWLEFKHPRTAASIRYENSGEFSTVALYLHEELAYLVVTPTFAVHFDQSGCPNPRYFVFKFLGDKWEQIPLMQSPLKQVAENMTVDSKSVRSEIKKRDYSVKVDEVVSMSQSVGPAFEQYDLTKVQAQTFACPDRKRFSLN